MESNTELKSLAHPPGYSLGKRFALFAGGVFALILVVATVLAIHTQHLQLHANLQAKGQLLGQFVASNSQEFILSYDFSTLNRFIQDIGQDPEVAYSVVINPEGHPLTTFVEQNNPYLQAARSQLENPQARAVLQILRSRTDLIHLSYPIVSGEQVLGQVLLGLTEQRAWHTLRITGLRYSLAGIVIILLLMAGIMVIFRWKVLLPLRQLMIGAQRIAKGQLDRPLQVVCDDEIGALTHDFNFMMTRLRDSILAKDQALHEAEDQNWINASLSQLAESVHGTTDVEALGHATLDSLANRLNLLNAGFYQRRADTLYPVAGYALEQPLSEVRMGQGLAGQAALTRTARLLNVGQDPQRVVHGGVLNGLPYCVYWVPLVFNDEVFGLLELGFQLPPGELHCQFLNQAAGHLAISVYAALQHAETRQALTQSREKTRLLEQQGIELRMAMEATERATKAKSIFFANMSHELRTPLNAILGYSEMLQEDLEVHDEPHLSEDAEKIHAAGKHLLTLVNNVLDISKIETGKMGLYIERINVTLMVKEVVNLIAPLVAKNHNTLKVQIGESLAPLYADLTKIRQILMNLLSNASKFCDQGVITLQVKPLHYGDQEQLLFRIIDTGIGMSQAQMDKLFQAFSQADESTTRKYGGTGLGLAISKEFAEMMGGTIEVNSELGKGSTFSVYLPTKVQEKTLSAPIEKEPPQAQPDPSPCVSAATPQQPNPLLSVTDEQSQGYALGAVNYLPADRPPNSYRPPPYMQREQPLVMVVEDDETTRSMMQTMLGKLGCEVLVAEHGKVALTLLANYRPDLILLDIMMPELDGLELARRLHAHPQWQSIPIIVLSAKDLTDQEHAQLAAHTQSIFQKGNFNRAELLEQIQSMLEHAIH